ncbi:MAG: hypothetical protein L0H73_00685 [Nitrococcus sp.]|nr:hypothetical protein [Nitrococcus sp.]
MSQEADREFIRNFILVLAALAVSGLIFAILGVRLADAQKGPQADEQLRSQLSADLSQPLSHVSTASELGLVATAPAGNASNLASSGQRLVAHVCSARRANESVPAPQVNNKA